ncbi:MAG: XapX domain-containing protein [Halobacteriota archaeon]|uniref:XapX domain-containing protein n=1 Tax=Halodesulfurarchaeum sp. HSR-GB TaxID=3074077 RepID=UPI002866FBE1|nr:XapX domain-containing protein [Halodesulfurarchaeum sp. HSR-GB]MDR5655572.1 XapX domain-containing protein [Halodesulfurarchaeum sp. HSR-GB]
MNAAVPVLALLTGLLTGVVFGLLKAPIPAPPSISGVLGILGIYLGYVAIEGTEIGVDLLAILGLR